jgi:hypothetical protein
MSGIELVRRIKINTVESMLGEDKPVLIACIRDDLDYHGTLVELETVAVYMGPNLKVYIASEDLLPFFERRYGITGTPTFLLIQHGDLIDSLLGKTSVECLLEFLKSQLSDHKGTNLKRRGLSPSTQVVCRQEVDKTEAFIMAGSKLGII